MLKKLICSFCCFLFFPLFGMELATPSESPLTLEVIIQKQTEEIQQLRKQLYEAQSENSQKIAHLVELVQKNESHFSSLTNSAAHVGKRTDPATLPPLERKISFIRNKLAPYIVCSPEKLQEIAAKIDRCSSGDIDVLCTLAIELADKNQKELHTSRTKIDETCLQNALSSTTELHEKKRKKFLYSTKKRMVKFFRRISQIFSKK